MGCEKKKKKWYPVFWRLERAKSCLVELDSRRWPFCFVTHITKKCEVFTAVHSSRTRDAHHTHASQCCHGAVYGARLRLPGIVTFSAQLRTYHVCNWVATGAILSLNPASMSISNYSIGISLALFGRLAGLLFL